jgi:rubrerythrin
MDSTTLDNLKAAFAGESQANRKYLAFAQKAEEDGFKNTALLFTAIAQAETVHAMKHFKTIGGVGSTVENLQTAMTGENYEVTEMYPAFVSQAEEVEESAALLTFNAALAAEKEHEKMYADALQAVSEGMDIEVTKVSVCPVCGYTVIGDAPDNCPVCNVPGEKFIVFE